jgi:Effector protein
MADFLGTEPLQSNTKIFKGITIDRGDLMLSALSDSFAVFDNNFKPLPNRDVSGIMRSPWRKNYLDNIEKILVKIDSTKTGQVLVKHISNNTKRLTIKPLTNIIEINAFAKAENNVFGFKKAFHYVEVRKGNKVKIVRVEGKGLGTNVDIFFIPETFEANTPFFSTVTGAGVQTDETLFHEMIHALRMMLGVFNKNVMRDDYDDVDEFVAILIANIYLSEQQKDLRLDHKVFNRQSRKRSDSNGKKFYEEYKVEIKELCTDMPSFTRDLLGIYCEFNPILEYYLDTAQSIAMELK